MKKLLSILLACALLCGCNDQTASDTTTTTTSASTTTTTVTAVVTPNTTSSTTTSYVPTPWPPSKQTAESTLSSLDEYINSLPDSYVDLGLRYFEEHDHPDADPSNKELMELGESKLKDATKLMGLMAGLIVPDTEKPTLPHGLSEVYAIHEDFGDYDGLVKLCSETFHSDMIGWNSHYYSVELPEEVPEKYTYEERDDSRLTIHDILKTKMQVVDGITYSNDIFYATEDVMIKTTVEGVIRSDDNCVVYRLCSESDFSHATGDINSRIYWDSIMKLELIEGEWLITQIKSGLIR